MSLKTDLFGGVDDPNQYLNGVGSAPTADSENYNAANAATTNQTAQNVQGGNAFTGVTGDQGGQQAERSSLAQLQQQASGGMNAGDKAKLFQATQANQAVAKGAQDAIAQGAAQRGQANSGATLAQQLSAQQSAQESGANSAAQVASDASNRSSQAIRDAASLGGNLDQASTARQAATAGAQQQQQLANAQAQNAAAANNAQAANSNSQFNANSSNQQKQFYAQLMQKQYEDDLAKAEAQTQAKIGGAGPGIIGGLASAANGVGSAIGTGLKAYQASRGADATQAKAHGGMIQAFQGGGSVPGMPKVNHDSYANDVVDAKLSPGEVVVDLDTLHKGPDAIISFLEKETGMCFDRASKAHKKGK